MAKQAEIVSVWRAGGQVSMAVRVDEGGKLGSVEYIGSLVDDEAFAALTTAQKKAALVGACKATRDAALGPIAAALPSMTGVVTL